MNTDLNNEVKQFFSKYKLREINISNIKSIPNSNKLECAKTNINIVIGTISNSAFVIIEDACRLVLYSSSIFIISNFLLSFIKYFFIPGIFKYIMYSFWYSISEEKLPVFVPCLNSLTYFLSPLFSALFIKKYAITIATNAAPVPHY